MIRIYKPSFEDFVAEALDVEGERPVVYLQTRVESSSDERRQPDGSLLITPVNEVSVLASAWNRQGRVIAWQISNGRVYYRQDGDYDALVISERFQGMVGIARVVEESVRQALTDRFDVRAGVVDDAPVYGSRPAWLEE